LIKIVKNIGSGNMEAMKLRLSLNSLIALEDVEN
jgi:hypothetical protein